MLGNKKPRIINVTRKPSKCPDCGSSVVDIIYGTGDMTEIEFVLQYRKDGIMWAALLMCLRFPDFIFLCLAWHSIISCENWGSHL